MNTAALRTARPSSGRPSFTFSRTGSTVRSDYDGQVLNDEHPDHHPGREGAEDPLLAQGLEDNSGARERDQGPQPHRLDPPQIQQQAADPVAEGDGERHLDRGAEQGDAPHGRELCQGEVQPDGEQEERHPDLRQQLYLVHVPDGRTEGVRTDEDAGGDVAEDQGQPQPAGHDARPGGRPPG